MSSFSGPLNEQQQQEHFLQLRRTDELFRLLVENARDYAIFLLDVRGSIVSWNIGAERMLGFQEEEILGQSGAIIFTSEDQEQGAFEQEMQTAREQGRAENRRWYLRKDGSRLFAEGILTPLHDEQGQLHGYGKILRDATEQQQAQDALRENEQLLRHLTRSIPGGSLNVFDRDFRYLFAAGQGLEQVGLSPEQLVGRTLSEIFPPEAVDYVTPYYHRAFAGESLDFELEVAGRWFLVQTAPLLDAKGAISAVIALAHDITERKRVEAALQASMEALRVSEERFRAMFEQASVGIVQVTLGGRMHLPNPGFCKIIGYTEDEARRLSVRDVTHPEDYEAEAELTRRLIEGEIPGFTIEKRYVRKDGQFVWGQMTTTLVRHAAGGGEPIYALAVVEDITERKCAEDALRKSLEALRASEGRYRALADLSPDAILVNAGGYLVYANAAAARLLGAGDPREIVGLSPFDLLEPEYHGLVRERIHLALEEGRVAPPVEYRWRRLDGSTVDVEVTSGSISWQGAPALQVVARDITKRLRSEEALRASMDALRESEEKYRTLFESIDEGFCLIDLLYDENGQQQQQPVDHRIIEANPAFERHTGLTNPAGRLASELMPGVEQFWNDIYAGVVATGESTQFEQHSPAFGRWFEVEVVRVGSESLRRVAVIFRDVTERKAAEDAVRAALEAVAQAKEELEQRVQERTHALEERSQALSERTAQVQDLLRQLVSVQEAERGRISRELHDQLGQHLTGLMLGMDALRAAQPPGSDSARLAERLQQAAADLSGEAHRLAWNLRPPSLDDIGLEAALSTFLRRWQAHQQQQDEGIKVDFHSRGVDKEHRLPPEVETTFYRVVQEALTNVSRHAQGVSSVSIVLDGQDSVAQLTIEDDGAGFDAEAVLANTKRLGLRGMQERAALLGGTLEVESSPGAGTTLFIRVPLLACQPAEEESTLIAGASDEERRDDY